MACNPNLSPAEFAECSGTEPEPRRRLRAGGFWVAPYVVATDPLMGGMTGGTVNVSGGGGSGWSGDAGMGGGDTGAGGGDGGAGGGAL